MRLRAFFTAVLFLIFPAIHSQEEFVIDWNIDGQPFEDFVLKAESRFPVKFFYNDEWVKGLTLDSYGNRPGLKEVLDTLFKGEAIYFYTSKSGNIILTKGFEIKTAVREDFWQQHLYPRY